MSVRFFIDYFSGWIVLDVRHPVTSYGPRGLTFACKKWSPNRSKAGAVCRHIKPHGQGGAPERQTDKKFYKL